MQPEWYKEAMTYDEFVKAKPRIKQLPEDREVTSSSSPRSSKAQVEPLGKLLRSDEEAELTVRQLRYEMRHLEGEPAC